MRKPNCKEIAIFTFAVVMIFLCFGCRETEQKGSAGKYKTTWQSLNSHPQPQWLIDAKFGIYAHWGVYSVPAYGNEWYAMLMYDKANKRNIYQHHMEKYGGPAKVGYKDFIPQFRAEKFDSGEWADIIARSGAKYAGIAVVHHDGFGLWDSDVSKWNVGKMGPKRDLYGELVKSLRARGLKTIATFHHIRSFDWYVPDNEEYAKEGKEQGWDLFDPEYAELYWNSSTSTFEEFIIQWKAKVREVTDKYQPDVLWFDGGKFQTEEASRDVRGILAYYLNKGEEWGKEVEVLNKLPSSMKFNFPYEFGVLTYEGGRDRPEFVERPWIDDLKIGLTSWGYVDGLEYMTANEIVDGLVDRVSRNGGLLLSLSPKADGTLPREQKDILLDIGGWLEVNGEAIYGTRPWKIQAEGPVDKLIRQEDPKSHKNWAFDNCDAGDIRFTRKGDVLYAIALGWPEDGKIEIKSLGKKSGLGTEGIKSISMLGSKKRIKWQVNDDELLIKLKRSDPGQYAYTFKIDVEGGLDK